LDQHGGKRKLRREGGHPPRKENVCQRGGRGEGGGTLPDLCVMGLEEEEIARTEGGNRPGQELE